MHKKTSFNDRLIENLHYACDLYHQNQKGLGITLMTVMNKLNYHEMHQYVALTKNLGAQRLWIKPMEIHGEAIKPFLITKEQEREYALKCKITLHLAKLLNVKLHQSYVLTMITEEKRKELQDLDLDFKVQFKEELLRLSTMNLYQFIDHNQTDESLSEKALINNYQADQQQDIQNAAHPLKYFDQHPCSIANEYIRFKTDGSISPCCIYPGSFMASEERKNKSFQQIWEHPVYQGFFEDTQSFPQNHGHRKNPKFNFCHQCPHMDIHENMRIRLPDK